MSRSLDLLRRDLWPYLFAPLVIVAMMYTLGSELPFAMLPHVLRDTFVFVVCLGVPVHLLHKRLGERLGLLDEFRWRHLAIHGGIIAASVAVGTELAFAAMWLLHGSAPMASESAPNRQSVWLLGFLGNSLVTLVMVAFSRYRERIGAIELRELRARHELLAAQVEALQARIQPHFLFNSLNMVASLIQEDPARAEGAVERLSELYRYTLEASSEPFVTLADELDAVEGFVELETLRYGDRLKVVLHVDPRAREARVPPLVLQPIVENAVVHGIAPRREGGRIEISAERGQHRVVLRVEDDGPGPGGSNRRGSGTALSDLQKRLELVYGGRASLRIERGALGGFRVEVELPLDPAARLEP